MVASEVSSAAGEAPLQTSSSAGQIALTLSVGLRYSPPYSSRTAWKLVPPKPNELAPPRRGVFTGGSHGCASLGTNKGEPGSLSLALGFSTCRVGGSTL